MTNVTGNTRQRANDHTDRFDLLSEVLDGVRLKGFLSSRNEFTAPWGVRVPGRGDEVPEGFRNPVGLPDALQSPSGGFYIITQGKCWLQTPSLTTPLQLMSGDLVFILDDRAHQLRDSPHSPLVPLWELRLEENNHRGLPVRLGGGGELTTFICGTFIVENREQSRLVSALPTVMHVRAEDHCSLPWLETILQMIGNEGPCEPGAQSLINHVAHVLFIQAVRSYVSRLPAKSGKWLSALLDPDIGPALGLIHSRPQAPWTVASLAESVAMSRSAFAARFTDLVGQPPLAYVSQFRMAKATRLLEAGHEAIKQVAESVGYDSEAAFSKAFKREYGVSPGIYRKEEQVRRASE